MAASSSEKERLFRQVRHQLGAPLRKIELTDEQLTTLLEISIEDYSEYVQSWLTEHQWSSLLGQYIDSLDMAFALSVRSIDFETQYTYAYSKQVGLQQRGPWELKKDYIVIQAGKQVYEIPAGREINQVLWLTPSTIDRALFANYGGFDYGFGGGFAQMGMGAGGYGGGTGGAGNGGYYIAPAFDVLLTAADLSLKNKFLRSDLVYKITAGPNGTRLLHLISTPGSKMSFGNGTGNAGVSSGSLGLTGSYVWYYYYDTTPETLEDCRRDNKDIIKLPNEVPFDRIDYNDLNEPTKVLIRQLLTAIAKKTLGRVRGKFGGIVGPPEAERTMDYESLLSEGNEEQKIVMEKLNDRLMRLTSVAMLQKKSEEAEFLNKHLRYRPLGFYVK